MVKTLRLILGDQLAPCISALRDLDPRRDVVLMAEVGAETTYVRHHKKKIAFVLAAMRAFARKLERAGVNVCYVKPYDADNTGALGSELARAAAAMKPDEIVVTEAGEHRLMAEMEHWEKLRGARLKFVKIAVSSALVEVRPVMPRMRKERSSQRSGPAVDVSRGLDRPIISMDLRWKVFDAYWPLRRTWTRQLPDLSWTMTATVHASAPEQIVCPSCAHPAELAGIERTQGEMRCTYAAHDVFDIAENDDNSIA